MSIGQIEQNVQNVLTNFSKESFIYDLLLAYDLPKSSITRLRDGSYNLSKKKGGPLFGDNQEILWKKKLFFKEINEEDLHGFIHKVQLDENINKHSPRFMVVTDYETFLAYDTKTKDTLDIEFKDIPKHFDFFLPWAGIEKAQAKLENPADVKAAYKMAKLYDLIRQDNPEKFQDRKSLHELNVFLSRLLFCYFAEDTGIFPSQLFSINIESHTRKDGSDMHEYLDRLFDVLNTPYPRTNLPEYLESFPYVNGGLFADKIQLPTFSPRSCKVLIECGSELNWSEINPDIFGSMIQAVVHPDQRSGMGMHYTSIVNIMKVIEPLFLSDLYEDFKKAYDDQNKLKKLIEHIYNLRIFDPACGSGNFLIVAYKELRKLEIAIFKRLVEISPQWSVGDKALIMPGIRLSQFYGIELDDFAHEIAKLSLWLAEHQMNQIFKNIFGQVLPCLPLKEAGQIQFGNALRVDWALTCPPNTGQVYVLSNPPYVSYSDRDDDQKDDMDYVFDGVGNVKRLDYIGCWFKKASDYVLGTNAKYAFVSTNSICQGEQVSLLWPYIFNNNQEIFFAHQSFKWSNNAKSKAGVTCIIVGVNNKSNNQKYLFTDTQKRVVKNISPYLIEGNSVAVSQRPIPISEFPEMALGSSGIDGGHLVLSPQEKNTLIKSNPEAEKFIKPFLGGGNFIDGTERYCLWIEDQFVEDALRIAEIKDRIEKCRLFRLGAGRDARKAAEVPHRFFYRKYHNKPAIILPMTSSEKRHYIPVGFIDSGIVPSNGVFVIYDAEPMFFGILSSRIHMVWIHAVAGKLESRIRYSVNLNYNTFPFPPISTKQKEIISTHVFNIIEEREKFPERTIAELYDTEKMPLSLLKAHEDLDAAVERCYRSRPFDSDDDRLEYLFKLYEEMAEERREKCLI
jgi:hypothetical protein